jgi:hypothetical protein
MMPFVICQEGNVMHNDLNGMMLCNMTWTLITKEENLRKQWHKRLLDSMPKFFFYRCPFSNSLMLYTPQYDTHDSYSVINWCNHEIISNNLGLSFIFLISSKVKALDIMTIASYVSLWAQNSKWKGLRIPSCVGWKLCLLFKNGRDLVLTYMQ